jgi:glycosyltransferase involved in cell wall biosynthesis
MRVLLAAVSSSSRPDGVSRHAANVARCLLMHEGIERIDLVIGAWQEASFRALLGEPDDRIKISVATAGASSWSRNHWYWVGLPRLANAFGSNIVHLTFPVPIHRSAFSCSVIATLHDLYPYDIPENFGYPRVFINRAILHQCLRAVDRVACVSNSTAQRLAVHFPSVLGKSVTIYNSVTASLTANSRTVVCDLLGEPFLLSVAQHRRNKNIPLTIHVFHALLQSGDIAKNTRLLILGTDGPETTSLNRLIQQVGLQAQVSLLRDLSEAELLWCYTRCELLIATSTIEGFGLPIVEAMLHRCRVICSDIPAFREVGGSYCDFVPLSEEPVEAFASAVRNALTNRKFRPAATDCFSSARVGMAYFQLYLDLSQKADMHRLPSRRITEPAFERGRP